LVAIVADVAVRVWSPAQGLDHLKDFAVGEILLTAATSLAGSGDSAFADGAGSTAISIGG
jgi:hypothetical protein